MESSDLEGVSSIVKIFVEVKEKMPALLSPLGRVVLKLITEQTTDVHTLTADLSLTTKAQFYKCSLYQAPPT